MLIRPILLGLFLVSCASKIEKKPVKVTTPREYSRGEIILTSQLLTKIFDREMAVIECVPDAEEAALLLRTLSPRLETVQDDIEAALDDAKEVKALVNNCDQNCTCNYLDDLLREHLVDLPKDTRKILDQKKKIKDLNSCLNYAQSTFCQSELYSTLNMEKSDFSFEDAP